MGNLPAAVIAPVVGTATQDHGPVTHILGEEIKLRKPIVQSNVEVSDSEKLKFLMARQELLDALRDTTRTDDQLLNALQMSGTEVLYRAAARKVGMEDYREADMNINFITRLRELTQAYYQQQASLKEADLATERLKESNDNDLVVKDIASDRDLAPDDQLRDKDGNPATDSLAHLSSMVAADQATGGQEGNTAEKAAGPDLSLEALSKSIKEEEKPAEPASPAPPAATRGGNNRQNRGRS
jgi:hypothetical protein